MARKRTTTGTMIAMRRGAGRTDSFSATEVQNRFGSMLEKALQGRMILITKHDTPKAVLMSMDEYNGLANAPQTKIDTLSAEFDAQLARMQGPKARKAMLAAFHATPEELGKAAVMAARKHD